MFLAVALRKSSCDVGFVALPRIETGVVSFRPALHALFMSGREVADDGSIGTSATAHHLGRYSWAASWMVFFIIVQRARRRSGGIQRAYKPFLPSFGGYMRA